LSELRAATRLTRLAAAARWPDETAVSREVFETFTKGFDTLDLLEARRRACQGGHCNPAV